MSIDIQKPQDYWERAGELSYNVAMFQSATIGEHIFNSIAQYTTEAAQVMGVKNDSRVLELGCGDGHYAKTVLAPLYRHIESYDQAAAGIERAKQAGVSNISFAAADCTNLSFLGEKAFDACFMIGFLHHVKWATADIISDLYKRVPHVIVMEPNGNHLMRKFLEQLPSYKAAGEDSFRRRELERLFTDAGYKKVYHRPFNLFPNFTPHALFPLVKKIEPIVEYSAFLNWLCTAQVYGFSRVMGS